MDDNSSVSQDVNTSAIGVGFGGSSVALSGSSGFAAGNNITTAGGISGVGLIISGTTTTSSLQQIQQQQQQQQQQQMGTNSATTTGINNKPSATGAGGNSGGGVTGSGQNDDTNGGGGGSGSNQQQTTPQYTIPGIIHFIQHEWSRFELERSQWDIDRAELQARIAMLLGERKGQESLKSDLIRRIKMLEYALKQERVKFHRLKYGCDPPTINELKPPSDETGLGNDVAPDSEVPYSSVSNTTWRQGRQILRQYLEEIGYTDTIIDVRSNRVRQLLGMNNNANNEKDNDKFSPNMNGNGISGSGGGGGGGVTTGISGGEKRPSETQGRQPGRDKKTHINNAILESEAAVIANFAFLAQTDVEMSDDDEISDDLDMVGGDNDELKTESNKMNIDDVDAEAEELLNDLNLLTEGFVSSEVARRNILSGNTGTNNDEDQVIDQSLGLGELAQLTVNNEAETTYDVSNTKESAYRKTWNAKYTLRSHFDGVRALAFHPDEPVLITASEDHTLKLWNLQKTVPAKKSASLDVEPLYTFRAHSGPVLCLAMSTTGEYCYSGGLDGQINCWKLPNSNIDPYDCYDPSVLRNTLEGHCDAIWGLSVNHTKGNLISCSADGTVKLWSPNIKVPLLQTYTTELDGGGGGGSGINCIPSSVDFVRDELDRIVVAYTNSQCIIYDTETGKQILKFETAGGGGAVGSNTVNSGTSQENNTTATVTTTVTSNVTGNNSQITTPIHGKFINKVISHPTLPITITAHEDRHIRFWDNISGTLIHSMVAHLEPVTSLAIDSHGLYLLSGSHDCSIRLWNLDNKTCVQEITAHRKKFDESIFDVAFHPSKPYIASAGADGLAKVFV